MLVYDEQAAFDATIQTLEAYYARTDNAAHTDNSLEISHLSVQIYTDNNTQPSHCQLPDMVWSLQQVDNRLKHGSRFPNWCMYPRLCESFW